MEKKCKQCLETLHKKDKECLRDWKSRKFCGNRCSAIFRMKNISDETKNKMRKSQIGKTPANKGIKSFFIPTSAFKKGQTPWNKGLGLKDIKLKIRSCSKYIQWRSDIFQRDDWRCLTCFKRGGKLEVHHIKMFSDIIKENNIKTLNDAEKCNELWNLNNGITLCKDCHKLTDNYGIKSFNKKRNELLTDTTRGNNTVSQSMDEH